MASLLQSLRSAPPTITDVDSYMGALAELEFYYQGNAVSLGNGLTGTYGRDTAEETPTDLEGYANAAYKANGIVFSCIATRMAVFAQIRFQWQQIRSTGPSKLFGTPELSLLESPWVGGTTQDWLSRALLEADLAGNSYWARLDNEMVRLRADWCWWVLEPRAVRGGQAGWRRVGLLYFEGGKGHGEPVPFLPEEILHFAPSPDPLAPYRGMSWLTPVLREVQNDKLMGRHKSKFFSNAATPNLSVSLDKEVSKEAFKAFADKMSESHRGVDNAYKTLYLGGGADVRVIGADFKQMDFAIVQGHGETRVAAAAGVPPIIVGLSEGLQSATYSNYGQARRRFADGTMHPLWQSIAGSAQQILKVPGSGTRLWFDTRDVPFLREDRKDAAVIAQTEASTIGSLITSGFTPDSAVAAVASGDWSLLDHSGLVSVQLQPPGADPGADQGADPQGQPAIGAGT